MNLEFRIFNFESITEFRISKFIRNSCLKIRNSRRAGFTLLETVVALGIIVGGVSGAFSLALKGVTDASVSKNKLIALNLAQEGVEIFRKIRDDNQLAGRAWDTSFFPSGCSKSWKADVFSTASTLQSYDASYLGYEASTGLYYYNASLPDTLFLREIKVEKPGPGCMSGKRTEVPDAAQTRISSIVSWKERAIMKTVILQEDLYDWK